MKLAGYDIPEHEVELQATLASGPGGQNVNRVATAIHLRFEIAGSSLPESCKERLLALRDHRISSDGVVIIKAKRYRSQESNRRDALRRLEELILQAQHTEAARKPTRPSAASRRKRVDEKKARGQLKKMRGTPGSRDD